MAKQPETILKEKVQEDLDAIKSQGGRIYRIKIQQVAIRGTPDLLLGVSGRFVALELKRDKLQAPDPLQDRNLLHILDAGCLAFVVHPENWPEVRDIICAMAYSVNAERAIQNARKKLRAEIQKRISKFTLSELG